MARPLERFCKRGHDTAQVGRIRNGWCKACADLQDAMGGSITGRHKGDRSPEWERARVHRWLEIVAVDRMNENKSTRQRGKDFQQRYERLEADVPTPVEEWKRLMGKA